jgi:hypothetical protein
MKKETWLLVILTVIVIILIVVFSWPTNNRKNNSQNPLNNNQSNQTTQQVEGIQVISPQNNAEVSSPLKITGSVNSGGWAGFEGQVGTVQLLDYKGNKVAEGILKATTDWTKPPVQFESTLAFTTKTPGPMTLLFSNENPSGLPDKEKKFGLPVVVK